MHALQKASREILDACEQNIAQFHAFQAETLRVHAQYLRDQLEYTRYVLQTTQMQFAVEPLQVAQPPTPTQNAIQSHPVRLKSLPPPDRLDIAIPQNHICLLTDDGTNTTSALVAALQAMEWPIAVLSFPPSVMPERADLPDEVFRITLDNLEASHLEQQLQTLSKIAPIGALIHLHPHTGEALRISEREAAIVKSVFLLAKYLQPSLTQAAQTGRGFFITATRLDGQLGLTAPQVSPLAGGLFGLTKSLNLEWNAVFCRAIDLSPALAPDEAVRMLLAELRDPDLTITEVGCGPEGRFTLVCTSS